MQQFDQLNKLFEELETKQVSSVLKSKYDSATDEEKAQYNSIKKELTKYIKVKDYQGALKYLQHVKTKLK
jgi:hypothetical protein